ncbi:uncharacterized protein LOC130444163 [Diorhabda sublineata]|uniref:uncharacterized protein LOC130444163 n=1 Tax=Diorhabda sublineata TaxID=1163346 RepID=UPI0024E15655|nr:uncharacterized protein LOC130444163 [Diorhabda sublineata]
MKKEADEGVTIPLKNYRERVLAATGVSKSTFQKISKEAQKVEWGGPSTSFQSPKKIRNTKKRKLDRTSPDQIKSMREIIYDFYVLEKRLPTLKCVLQKINDRQILTEAISISSLNRLLKKIGFR